MRRWMIIVGIVGIVAIALASWFLLRSVRTETVVVNPPDEPVSVNEKSSEVPSDVVVPDAALAGDSSTASNVSSVTDQSTSVPHNSMEKNDASSNITPTTESSVTKDEPQDNEGMSKSSDSNSKLSVTNRLVSFGYQSASGRKIDTIIIHSTYNALGGDPYSVSKAIDIYKSYGVSPHYIVARDGTVYRLVEEKNIAYHAGDSKTPDGRSNVNAFSIGIEVLTKEAGDEPTDAQYSALRALLSDIRSHYSIQYILGHSDIAPGRKTDPWGFDWKRIGGKKK